MVAMRVEGSIVFEEPLNIIMVPGQNKFDPIALPTEKDPGLNPFPNFPVVPHQPLEP
jgi:hypothetical protein